MQEFTYEKYWRQGTVRLATRPPIPQSCQDTGKAYGDAVSKAKPNRRKNTIETLRTVSNAAKDNLYEQHLGQFHLEIGFGRGGDSWKLAKRQEQGRLAGVVGLDSSPLALEEARDRAEQSNLNVRLFLCDACRYMWATTLKSMNAPLFDSVSLHFSLHYLVESRKTTEAFFKQLQLTTERNSVIFGVTIDDMVTNKKVGKITIRNKDPSKGRPKFGRIRTVHIPDLVESNGGGLEEFVVDWRLVELIGIEHGFFIESLRPMVGDPTKSYVEFVFRRFGS